MTEPSRLAVVVDGAPLDPDAARALWTEFSAHMDEHRGDFAGFARKKGWFGVTPEYQQGKAVLVVRTTAAAPRPAPTPAAPQAPKPKAAGPKPPKPGPHPPRKRAGAKPQAKPKPKPAPGNKGKR